MLLHGRAANFLNTPRIYNENGPFFASLGLFFSTCNSCIGGFGPFETLTDPFPRGPQGLVPPPPPTSGIISPALTIFFDQHLVGMTILLWFEKVEGPLTIRGKWGKADFLRNSMQYFFTENLY